MNVVQAGFLIGGLAVMLPIIVHLLSRWQVRRVEIGTMRFLNEVIRDGAKTRRIRRWFLLLTRMALVILLAMLFARPFIAEPSRRDGDRLRVILIDRSASMSMPGRQGRLIDDAVSEALHRVSELGEDAKIVWAWFDRAVEPIADVSSRLTAPKVVSGGTNYQAALSFARDQVHANPTSVADVVLVTDLQSSGLRDQLIADSKMNFPTDVPVHIVDVGRPAASNLAITSLAVPSTRLSADRPAKLTATLFNHGSLAFEDVPIVASAQLASAQLASAQLASAKLSSRAVRLKKTVQIGAGQAQEVEFDLDKLSPGVWQFSVSLDVNDDLASDNVRYAAMEVANPYEVMVIDRNIANGADSYSAASFLVAALQQGSQSLELVASDDTTSPSTHPTHDAKRRAPGRFLPRWIDLEKEGFPQLSADQLTLVAVANASNLTGEDLGRLERFTSDGGRLLVFAGNNTETNSNVWVQHWNDSKLVPGQLGNPQASGVSLFRISSFATGSSMLEPFEDPQHGDLKRLSFHKILPVQASTSTRVLAWFDEQRPAITQHNVGKGSVVFFMSSSDSSWSNWTLSPLYLPLVQQMSGELLNLNGEGPIRFRTVGDVLLATRGDSNESQTANANSPRLTLVSTRDADGEARSAAPLGSDRTLGLTLNQVGFEQRAEALYVVNMLAAESDPTRVSPEVIAERYGLSLAVDNENNILSTVSTTKRIELWPWLAATFILLLVAEFALANRTAP